MFTLFNIRTAACKKLTTTKSVGIFFSTFSNEINNKKTTAVVLQKNNIYYIKKTNIINSSLFILSQMCEYNKLSFHHSSVTHKTHIWIDSIRFDLMPYHIA